MHYGPVDVASNNNITAADTIASIMMRFRFTVRSPRRDVYPPPHIQFQSGFWLVYAYRKGFPSHQSDPLFCSYDPRTITLCQLSAQVWHPVIAASKVVYSITEYLYLCL